MHLFLINSGMTVSILLFYSGFYFRKKNNKLHRILNSIGILVNLVTAIFLLVGKHMLGGIESMEIVAITPQIIVDIHRFFAAISLVLMLLMGYSGWKRNIELHKKTSRVFLFLYTTIYISGLIIFQTGSK